jgi:protein-disulfide isomerase
MEQNARQRDYFLPGSIVIAAVLISVSLIYSTGKNAGGGSGGGQAANLGGGIPTTPSAENARPVDSNDHIRGSKNADVIVIEYSDFECPFCKRFHTTMQEATDFYGDKIAWVYRQFPIPSLHSQAWVESVASECAAELGGNDAFWAYADRILEVTPSNDGLDLSLLPQFAKELGLDQAKFEACLDSERHDERIAADIEDASNAGARGTPYSVVINKDGDTFAIPGALPFSGSPGRDVKSIIDQALGS